eukprot:1890898-Heterocapsa_arctica.AAC.1
MPPQSLRSGIIDVSRRRHLLLLHQASLPRQHTLHEVVAYGASPQPIHLLRHTSTRTAEPSRSTPCRSDSSPLACSATYTALPSRSRSSRISSKPSSGLPSDILPEPALKVDVSRPRSVQPSRACSSRDASSFWQQPTSQSSTTAC